MHNVEIKASDLIYFVEALFGINHTHGRHEEPQTLTHCGLVTPYGDNKTVT